MENPVLTNLLVQANVREILSQAERDRLTSNAPNSASRIGGVLVARLTRLWRTPRPQSLAALRQEVASQ